ncbi:hypothetical protein EQM14_05150 [Caproiciproducens sp. NJN-50]|uniref:DUF7674 family protein n=1 Tax=Acutalibacteraceae TaxID=3082771 RepID=UPI000FFE09CB|nr:MULTISPECIES: hypothetical protein [Acutalibacteraceae]QAT49212.1 hypothetical protein EQM14_05150 [Caproiciproducens sp. NJN-50]
MMDQKVFEMVAGGVEAALNGQGYRRAENKAQEDGREVYLLGESVAYSVLYQESAKRFVLRTCEMDGEEPDGKWKSLSTWLYDPDTDTPAQAQSIADDFTETLTGPKQTAAAKARKKRKKDDDNNADPVFFFNRFVGLFPELKEELNAERSVYGDVRAVTFARERLLPKINALVNNPAEKDRTARCCQLLNDLYLAGDMDVRSIITIVILNGIEGGSAVETVRSQLGEDLLKSYKAGLKMKGKKVKPEKKQKKKKFMADTLLNR